MICSKCGQQLPEGAQFCANCGEVVGSTSPVEQPVYQQPAYQQPVYYTQVQPQGGEKKIWQVFAKLGFIFGLISFIIACVFTFVAFIPIVFIATYWLLILGAEFGSIAIVFSALGKKSALYKGKANKGLIFSIIGTALSIFIIIIFFTVVISLLIEDTYYYDDPYYYTNFVKSILCR